MNQLTKIDPIPLPDLNRAAQIPSWPEWLERLNGAVRAEIQPIEGTFQENVLVLPHDSMPNTEQQTAMQNHIASLRSYLSQTPESGDRWETEIASLVTKLLLVKPASRKSDIAAEALADEYLDVLDDVPWWAVKAAIRSWHRHECGHDERGRAYDYHWAPDPGELRKVALERTFPIRNSLRQIERVLNAREYVDCADQLEKGRLAMIGLMRKFSDSDVGDLTFADAVELGKKKL